MVLQVEGAWKSRFPRYEQSCTVFARGNENYFLGVVSSKVLSGRAEAPV